MHLWNCVRTNSIWTRERERDMSSSSNAPANFKLDSIMDRNTIMKKTLEGFLHKGSATTSPHTLRSIVIAYKIVYLLLVGMLRNQLIPFKRPSFIYFYFFLSFSSIHPIFVFDIQFDSTFLYAFNSHTMMCTFSCGNGFLISGKFDTQWFIAIESLPRTIHAKCKRGDVTNQPEAAMLNRVHWTWIEGGKWFRSNSKLTAKKGHQFENQSKLFQNFP